MTPSESRRISKLQRKGKLGYKAKAKAWHGAVRKFPDGREVCTETLAGKTEYKFRRTLMHERQHHICPLCGRYLEEYLTTFDHESGRGLGGSHRDDRILDDDGNWKNAAVHFSCNGDKGSQRYHWQDGQYLPVN